MSDVIYPISMIKALDVPRQDRTLVDEFEAGNVATRRYWDAYNFKRRITLQHGPLTLAELRYLRSFHAQRSGQYDSFWFRDNVNRGGNVKVRFVGALAQPWDQGARQVAVQLDEVAPLRALPDFEELATAAGNTPLLWYDANRELYIPHAGTNYTELNAYDAQAMAANAPWLGGGNLPLGNVLSQYQHYEFAGAAYAKTTANVPTLTGAQPACTVFAIAKHGTIASKAVLFGVGAMGAGKAVGIAISASNKYEPWIGGSESWTVASFTNSAINTWRSFAVTFPASSNVASFYVNGAAALTETETRDYTAGPATLGAAIDGTLKTTGNVAHILVFAAELTFAQVKAVHNLLGYQYGLTQV